MFEKKGYAHSPWQLYNLEDDRAERNDVAHRHPELLRQFDRIVQKEHQQAPIRNGNLLIRNFSFRTRIRLTGLPCSYYKNVADRSVVLFTVVSNFDLALFGYVCVPSYLIA